MCCRIGGGSRPLLLGYKESQDDTDSLALRETGKGVKRRGCESVCRFCVPPRFVLEKHKPPLNLNFDSKSLPPFLPYQRHAFQLQHPNIFVLLHGHPVHLSVVFLVVESLRSKSL